MNNDEYTPDYDEYDDGDYPEEEYDDRPDEAYDDRRSRGGSRAEAYDDEPYEEGPRTKRHSEEYERWYRRRERRRRFRVFLLIWTLVLLLIGGLGCFGLYRYLGAYEISRPEIAMDELMEMTDADGWYRYIRQELDFTVSEFEDADKLFSDYYDAVLRNAEFTYRKNAAESTDGAPVYTVRAAGRSICNATLTRGAMTDALFRLYSWKVQSVESCFKMDALESVAIEITAPAGESILLNGKSIDESYRIEDVIPDDITPLEQRFAEQPKLARYRVDEMFGDISVTDADGNALPSERKEDGTVCYLLREKDFYDFTVHAPTGVSVAVNGVELKEADAQSTKKGILEGLETLVGENDYAVLTYHFDHLYALPEITAKGENGETLTPLINEKGELTFFRPESAELKAEHEERVREFFDRYIGYSAYAYNADSYNALLSCIVPDTELYSYVKNSVDAMIWASATQVSYDELTFDDFTMITPNCFLCTIRYKADFSAKSWYEQYTYDMQNAYETVFVCDEEGVWYAAAMSVVAG